MIPKTIHYCWFGRNAKPKLAETCIRSWKYRCPDYTIQEWNEDNFDLSTCPLYVRQAYAEKKWAFVTDYVRLRIIFEHGGIYMDTDVELLKPLDYLLHYNAFFGYEDGVCIATGLGFGAEKGTPVLLRMMEDYNDIPFLLENGKYDAVPCPARNTEALKELGLKQDDSKQILDGNILILPTSYLCPIDFQTRVKRIHRHTLSIHWYSGSWYTEEEKRCREELQRRARREKVTGPIQTAVKNALGEEGWYRWQERLERYSSWDQVKRMPRRIVRKLLGKSNAEE